MKLCGSLRVLGGVLCVALVLLAVTACQTVRETDARGHYSEASVAGDLNGDGVVTAADVRILRDYLIAERSLTAAQKALADLDGDGVLTAKDVYLLNQLVEGEAASTSSTAAKPTIITGRPDTPIL